MTILTLNKKELEKKVGKIDSKMEELITMMGTPIEEIKEALQKPDKITTFSFDEDIKYYYKYVKSRVSSAKYLLAIVKYLNGEGYIITSYFVRHIK